MSRGAVLALLALASCGAVPGASPVAQDTAQDTGPPTAEAAAVPGFEPTFLPSLAPRAGRPCGDVVGLSMSGPFTAAILQLGETRSLTDATPEMIACVETNGLEVEFTSGG